VIVVDTSSIFAILYEEKDAARCSAALLDMGPLVISAATLAEARVVAARARVMAVFEEFISRIEFEVVVVDAATAAAVGRAYAQWGKGLHPAGLNFGDCFAYVLARERGCPLLFVGNDFAQTDVARALP
jgi:ribonuclease VapC